MNAPAHIPGLPDNDTIVGTVSTVSTAMTPQLQTLELQELPWANAVWLAPDACLMQSHVPPNDAEPVEIQIVGVADFGDWAGAVLMLG